MIFKITLNLTPKFTTQLAIQTPWLRDEASFCRVVHNSQPHTYGNFQPRNKCHHQAAIATELFQRTLRGKQIKGKQKSGGNHSEKLILANVA